MTIKFLSDSAINRIAAGEVIERPASVVKELVENAIDAGATVIDVILERAGKNLIIISDNGIGMSDKELEIAIQRHTTSKFDEDDFLNINSFGFRGEALPSIGAISKMIISSRAQGAQSAHQIQLIGGSDRQLKPVVHNIGTKVEIRDLFFATPARLKFLRSDKTEFAAAVDVMKRIALAHPEISLSLTHDGKNIIKVKWVRDGLAQRITEIMKQEFIDNAAYIDFTTPEVSVRGYTSVPTFNRASAEDQFFFINNRPVKDKLLHVAIKVAYQDYLPSGRHPVSVIFIRINPQLVDVNVHPAKSEVRFHDPNMVRSLMIGVIKDALKTKSHFVSTHVAAGAVQSFGRPVINHTAAQDTSYVSDNGKSAYRPVNFVNHFTAVRPTLMDTAPQAKVEVEETSPAHVQSNYRLGAAKAQLHATYIISQTTDSIVITDQHAAHERLGYEKIKQMIAKNGIIKQRLLIPEIVELPDDKRAELLYAQQDNLSKLGLSVEKFGDQSIIVTEIPALLGNVNVAQLIQDLADHLSDIGENISLIKLIEHVTETYACHYSIRAGRVLSSEEMNSLLRQMENTPFSAQCNHGRPTYIELKLKDIERLFGRK